MGEWLKVKGNKGGRPPSPPALFFRIKEIVEGREPGLPFQPLALVRRQPNDARKFFCAAASEQRRF